MAINASVSDVIMEEAKNIYLVLTPEDKNKLLEKMEELKEDKWVYNGINKNFTTEYIECIRIISDMLSVTVSVCLRPSENDICKFPVILTPNKKSELSPSEHNMVIKAFENLMDKINIKWTVRTDDIK